MTSGRAAASLLALAGAGLASCGGDSADKKASSPPPATTATNAADADRAARDRATETAASKKKPGTRVTVRKSDYGRILTDARGHTLYLFTREPSAKSRCYGACATAWPPLLAKGTPGATGAARGKLVGTTRRRDGKRQLTYAGHPVYYYVGETKAGQVLCQNVAEFGGTWLVVNPDGTAVR
jgi:predicted lipoprotein with Yx(FWY)xxD motif